jgi:pimeloyl-ACP methyl ester carboxylesterase
VKPSPGSGPDRRRLLVPVALALIALSFGAGDARAASAVGAPIAWGPCKPAGPRLQCARIRVPLDWGRPHGRTISLALIRHRASRPGKRIGTMFINPGGPGDTGVGLLHGLGDEIDAWGGGRFDVVSWDPRGGNGSTHVRCFRSKRSEARFWKGAAIPTTAAAARPYARKVAALARRCADVSGRLLPHISTADTARDLDHLRRLVGDRKLTYVGLSYGTYLGQTYANMFPRRVRAMLLDGIVDPVPYAKNAEARVAGQALGTDEVFQKFASLCQRAGPQRCALAHGTVTAPQRVRQLFARAKRGGIPAPAATPPGPLSYSDLLVSQYSPLRAPELWPDDARDLDAATRGDASALATASRRLLTPAAFSGATTSAAISCADAPARKGLRTWPREMERFNRVDRLSGYLLGWWLWAPCAAWRVRGQDNYRGPWNATTKNPILLIGNRYDPSTPYINAVRSARRLGNAVLLTLDGYGHVSFHDPSMCIDRARVAYLVRLAAPRKGTVCQADHQPFQASFSENP